MRVFVGIVDFTQILFNWDASKIASKSQLWLFEVSAQPFEVFEDLMGQLAGVARYYGLVRLVVVSFGYDLVEDRDDKDCSFAHP